MRDFTLEAYRVLLDRVRDLGYETCRVVDAIRTPPEQTTPRVILRHDVDRRPQRSLALAKLEHDAGYHSTYYVRTRPRAFSAALVKDLREMGHEVGYHYETVSTAGGDLEKAALLFKEELAKLRELVPIETAAMHGSLLSARSNMDVWKKLSPDEVQLAGEAYRSLQAYPSLVYLSDTGRSWGNTRNLRDRVPGRTVDGLSTTDSVIAHIREARPTWVYLQTHPERWVSEPLAWTLQYMIDECTNAAKVLIQWVRPAGAQVSG